MDSSLLKTKVLIPPLTGPSVARARLTDALETGVPLYNLILVSAPAGYGKTTLLAQWAHSSQFPVAWVSLDEAEYDTEHFLRYLFSAWQQVQPDVRLSELGTMLEGSSPDIDRVLKAFINLANEMPRHTAFVLDDYHQIKDASIHQALTYLLDHLPPTAHLILSTRADPPLPIARYRAKAKILELGAEDLKFGREETEGFLNQMMGLQLSEQDIEDLQTYLEGWAAGLRLAGIRFRQSNAQSLTPVITGKHRFVVDYLSQDVLDALTDNTRSFLLQTSILVQLSGPLCDALTGRNDGQAMLETLERENLFLIALDDNRDWFRYHHLFADFLRAELARQNPEQVTGLHSQAAYWYLAQDMPERAYQHALDAGDLKCMAAIFNRYANAKLQAGEFRVIKDWLDRLPGEWFSAYPALNLARAGYLAFTGAIETCLLVIDDVEKRLLRASGEIADQQLARVKVIRCFIACMANNLVKAEDYAEQALRELPEEDDGYRPGIYAALGDTYRQHGFWQAAHQCYQKALTFEHAPAIRVQSAHIYGALADLNLQQGRLQNAASYWQEALVSIQKPQNWGRIALPVAGWVYTRMAELLYEWNELEAASAHLARGLERAELGGDVRAQIAGSVLAANIQRVYGNIGQASQHLDHARWLLTQAPFPEWNARFERGQIELWLAENRLKPAADWAEAALVSGELQDRPDGGITQLVIARVLITQGDEQAVEQATTMLDSLTEAAEGEGRTGVLIEALALQSIAKWRRGDWPAALTLLERALRIAEPEGYVRLFVDLGSPMGRLLQEARSRGLLKDYVDKLLQVFGAGFSAQKNDLPVLPEPLTPREQEILTLVAAGLTNNEIASQLVISPETVKKHVGNISAKLNTNNRTEAVARARALGLLD